MRRAAQMLHQRLSSARRGSAQRGCDRWSRATPACPGPLDIRLSQPAICWGDQSAASFSATTRAARAAAPSDTAAAAAPRPSRRRPRRAILARPPCRRTSRLIVDGAAVNGRAMPRSDCAGCQAARNLLTLPQLSAAAPDAGAAAECRPLSGARDESRWGRGRTPTRSTLRFALSIAPRSPPSRWLKRGLAVAHHAPPRCVDRLSTPLEVAVDAGRT